MKSGMGSRILQNIMSVHLLSPLSIPLIEYILLKKLKLQRRSYEVQNAEGGGCSYVCPGCWC